MLKDLLEQIDYEVLQGQLDLDIQDICYHSQKIKAQSLFVCMEGSQFDGHDYIDEAIIKGAIAVCINHDVDMIEGITYIKVLNTRQALALLSCAFFKHPSHELTVIGITGTKGKTTTSYMIASILQQAQFKVGVIGTIGSMIDGHQEKTENTTPESYEIQRLMRKMVDGGCEYCVMEVSSQGLMLERVTGITFRYGIFTNLSPDHISENEHHSFDDYMACKKRLFQMCQIGFFNRDDQYFDEIIKGATCRIYTYSIHKPSDLQAIQLSLYRRKSTLGIYFCTKGLINDSFEVDIPGEFSVYNSLVAIMLCIDLNIDKLNIQMTLKAVRVKGRMEIVPVNANYTVIIDYAHNAFAYECLLKTIQQYHPHQIICVYGAGGHRDVKRRYDTGQVVAKYQAYSILTADNPRGENVIDICHDIARGIAKMGGEYKIIEDRQTAIYNALSIASDDDIILCLGKGHEDYQILDQEPLPFNERQIILNYFIK